MVQSLSHVQLFVTPWTAAHQAPLFFSICRSFAQTHVYWVNEAIQPSHPLSSPSPPAFSLSQHQGLSSESSLHIKWPKYWSFSFRLSVSNEYLGLIFFSVDWFYLLAVQRTLKRLFQHHSLKASVLQCSAFFMVQLSFLYMTTGKTTASTIQTFVGQVMSLLFNMLSRFVIAILPRNKHPLISWLQSPPTVLLEPKRIKSILSLLFLKTKFYKIFCFLKLWKLEK